MMKIIMVLVLSASSLFAMDWSEYEMLCYQGGVEPSYEEWVYLSEEGATDYGYEEINLEELQDPSHISDSH